MPKPKKYRVMVRRKVVAYHCYDILAGDNDFAAAAALLVAADDPRWTERPQLTEYEIDWAVRACRKGRKP